MKNPITLILCAVLAAAFLTPMAGADDQKKKDNEIYAEAQALFKAQKWEEAEKRFSYLAKRYPQHAKIRYFLNNVRVNKAAGKKAPGTAEDALSKIVIPQINLQDASLELVFEFLAAKVEELSGGETSVNFIYRGPQESREMQNINLRLSNIPVSEVIRYVGELSGTHFKYEPHAIVGMPRSQMAVPVAAEPEKRNDPFAPKKDADPFA
ncbi:MAG: hypothetical protein AAF585_03095 [Verrucomicrobiota bacterium]